MRALSCCRIEGAEDAERLYGLLDCREYVDEIKRRKSRTSIDESCAALFLLSKTLKKYFFENTAELKYKKDDKGRPYFENRRDIRFSLSHSGEYAVCAVSDEGDVGVDIERIPADKRYERTKERFLSDGEKRRAGDSAEGFTEVWTRKEAYYKYKGGRITDLDSEKDGAVEYDSFRIGKEYIVTVCREKGSAVLSEIKYGTD